MGKYSSKKIRQDPELLRKNYSAMGKWDIPIIKKCEIDINHIDLIGVHNILKKDNSSNVLKAVHFFVDDNKINCYFDKHENYLERLAQYKYLFTPDYSLYTDMPIAMQIYNTFRSRWCGAFWQDYGMSVIPTVNWSNEKSYEFCFEGLESDSVVAISTLGCLKQKSLFLKGYNKMKKLINPRHVLCYGKAFPEMGNEVIVIDYLKTTRRAS